MKNKFFLVIGTIFSALTFVASLSFVLLQNSANNANKKYQDAISYYNETDFDFMVYNPIKSQLETISSNENVEKIFAYSVYGATVSKENKSYDVTANFADDISNISISMFNSKRLIDGSCELGDNEIFIDKNISEQIDAKNGDSISVKLSKTSAMSFVVKGIFKNNLSTDKSTVMFKYSGNAKTEIDSKYDIISIKNLMIKASNYNGCKDYLKSYIPYGEMLTRDYFTTDLEYETYVYEFEHADYSSKIYEKTKAKANDELVNKKYLDEAEKLNVASYIVLPVLIVLSSLMSFTTLKHENNRENQNLSRLDYVKPMLYISVISIIVALATGLIGLYFSLGTLSNSWAFILALLLAGLAYGIINVLIARKASGLRKTTNKTVETDVKH